jgi:transposase
MKLLVTLTTSGVVEGINNKLKLIKRSAYGFRNFERKLPRTNELYEGKKLD